MRKVFRRKRRQPLRELRVDQDENRLNIEIVVDESVVPIALWSRSSITRGWTRHALFHPADRCHATVLDTADLVAAHAAEVPSPTARRGERKLARSHLFVEVGPADDTHGTAGRRIPLGRAAMTYLGALPVKRVDGARVRAYVTKRGTLAVAINHNPGDLRRKAAGHAQLQMQYLAVVNGRLRMHGRLNTRNGEVRSATFVLRGRNLGLQMSEPLTVTPDLGRTQRRWGHHWYRVGLNLDCRRFLDDAAFVDDTYDAWLSVRLAHRSRRFQIRIGPPRFHVRHLTRSGGALRDDRAAMLTPYFTFKAKYPSVLVNAFDAESYRYLRRSMRTRPFRKLRTEGRPVWLIGERARKAQDNGYHLFRHLREQHPEVDAYYVIDRNSPERANVEQLGNVIDFKSKEHIRVTLRADVVAGSHHAEFLFPTRAAWFVRGVRATRVFLQHGVMGAKWTSNLYHKRSGFKTDMFVVSSEREKELIIRDFGFGAGEIANTGLARFDGLFAEDVPLRPKQVLIMPTWRWYLQYPEAYARSAYHRTWSSFLKDPRLRAFEERYGVKTRLVLHPNMHQYRPLFAKLPVDLIDPTDADVQHLIKESALLVTDYSSVGWDFAFLGKPVVYYQFDRHRLTPPHIDPDEELPGATPTTSAGLFAELEKIATTDFSMADEYTTRADRFIDHRDRANSERIFQHATALRPDRGMWRRLKNHELTYLLWQRIRRHTRYIPTMKWFYRLAKLLPMDPNLVVFEAGKGKQYADSPRYIYEELVRRGDQRTKVWCCSGRMPIADTHTRVVTRHSVAYYYYLARAGYWISNQNFPYYVTRRPKAVYLQTWHGTPLKRMLHDVDQVHGRDDGYRTRVSTMVRQWSALISPSPFATEAFRSAFRYDGEILETGYPRNDVFSSPDADRIAAMVRRRYNIRPAQRVVLYAPTFRDDQTAQPGRFEFELPIDLQRWHDEFGDNSVLLLRMHASVRSRFRIPKHLRDSVIDVSGYAEVQDLLVASDLLITDYSSVFFDYAALHRPILFYAYDLDHYRDVLRGFYLDYEAEVPGAIVRTQDDLLAALHDLDEVDAPYQETRDDFLKQFAPWDDGLATYRVVDEIFGSRMSQRT
jgi:CDP-glycerol glycerophosphotransferase